MSALVETTLRCSRTGCGVRFGPVDGWPGEARRQAQKDGWETKSGTVADDRCPAHPWTGRDDDPALFDLPLTGRPS